MVSGLTKTIVLLTEGAWVIGDYHYHLWERNVKFTEARRLADSLGKRLVNIGCGDWTWSKGCSTFTRALLESDVNVDVVPRNVPNFVEGNIEDLPFEDKEFGVAWVSHVLEHVENPAKALEEVKRVSDHQFIIVPHPLSAAAWFALEHKWVFFDLEHPVQINPPLNIFLAGLGNLLLILS